MQFLIYMKKVLVELNSQWPPGKHLLVLLTSDSACILLSRFRDMMSGLLAHKDSNMILVCLTIFMSDQYIFLLVFHIIDSCVVPLWSPTVVSIWWSVLQVPVIQQYSSELPLLGCLKPYSLHSRKSVITVAVTWWQGYSQGSLTLSLPLHP